MKEIMLKIVGKQFVGDEAEEQMEFITEGRMYRRGQAIYLIYDESEFSGFPGCKTTLKLKDDSVQMKRLGQNVGLGTELVFRKGNRFSSRYQTPYGAMDLEVFTNHVENNLSPEGVGNIDIDYNVSLDGLIEGRNQLKIEVTQ